MLAADHPTVLLVNVGSRVRSRYEERLEPEVRVDSLTGNADAVLDREDPLDVVLLEADGVENQQVRAVERVIDRNPLCRLVITATTESDPGTITAEADEFFAKSADREDVQTAVEVLLARSAYERQVEEYYKVAERIASLEVTHSLEDLRGNQELRDATARLQELQDDLDRLTDRIRAHQDVTVLFHDLDRGKA